MSKITQLLHEVRMSRKDLESVLDDPDIKLGYEVEFISKRDNIPGIKGLTFDEMLDRYKLEYDSDVVRENIKEEAQGELRAALQDQSKLAELLFKSYQHSHANWRDYYTPSELKAMLLNFAAKPKNAKKVEKNATTQFFWDYFDNMGSNKARKFYDYVIQKVRENPSYIKLFDVEFYDEYDYESILLKKNLWYPETSIEQYFADQLGIKFGSKGWTLTGDTSLEAGWYEGYELISPPMPIEESLQMLEQIFTLMNNSKGIMFTNESCGLHMGISFKDKKESKKADPLKLVMFIGENYLLDLFKRTENEYTQPHSYTIQQKLRSQEDLNKILKAKSIRKFLDSVAKKLSKDKYSSVNLGKMRHGYFEIRIAGNKNYEKNFSLVRSTALRYGRALQISLNPSYEREYTKKVYKFLLKTFGITHESNETDRIYNRLWKIYKIGLQHGDDFRDTIGSQFLEFADFVANNKPGRVNVTKRFVESLQWLASERYDEEDSKSIGILARIMFQLKDLPGVTDQSWNRYFKKPTANFITKFKELQSPSSEKKPQSRGRRATRVSF